MQRFLKWLSSKIPPQKAEARRDHSQTDAHLRRTGGHAVPRKYKPKQATPKRQPEYVDLDPHIEGKIDDLGPGKNVLIRNKFIREDTGTHETLKILDDSIIDTREEEGIDPYNSGQFDRSKNWEKRR
ncbi:MAG: hypothetical protein GWN47_11645 [Woeseiaceae bacterium]|nr:hypothetical protein [Woeseiaceae bacterium]